MTRFFEDPDIDVNNIEFHSGTPLSEAFEGWPEFNMDMINPFLENPEVDINNGGVDPPIVTV